MLAVVRKRSIIGKDKIFDLSRSQTNDLRIDHRLSYQLSYEVRWKLVVCEYGGNIGNMNVKGTMSVVPLALMTQLMDQRINSALNVVVRC